MGNINVITKKMSVIIFISIKKNFIFVKQKIVNY